MCVIFVKLDKFFVFGYLIALDLRLSQFFMGQDGQILKPIIYRAQFGMIPTLFMHSILASLPWISTVFAITRQDMGP